MKKSWAVYIVACILLVESFGFAASARADGAEELDRLMSTKTEGSAGMVLSTAPAAVTTTTSTVQPAKAVAVASDDIIKLTPDKTHVLRLDQDASSVIVANPANANVALDTPRLLVIMPRAPGATSFTVLNAKGETILEKTIVVSAVQPHYVRVRRACSGQDSSCNPSAYYYCPDGCYEVSPVPSADSNSDVPEVVGGAPAAFDNQPVAPNNAPALPPQLPSIPLSNDDNDAPTEPEGDE